MMTMKMNLQLFAGEKTERATPRRREEARKKGQVAKSNEIVSVLVLTAILLALQVWLPDMFRSFQELFVYTLKYAKTDFTVEKAMMLFLEILLFIARMLGPVLVAAVVAGYVSNIIQTGFLFTTQPLKVDLNRLNPVNGLQRIISKRALAELVKSIGKTCLVGYVAYKYLKEQIPALSVMMDVPLDSAMNRISQITFSASWRVLGILFILAVLDYAFQRYEYEESLKMSKQEIKEEYKTIEGDPLLKAKIKEKQRMLATRRMMQEVPKATVVITNPTHYAAALRYETGMAVPVLVAKGQDLVALRIKEIAGENKVAIVENVNLARLLYRRVGVGMAVPPDLYQAVAEVIAYVYRLRKHR